MRGFLDRSRDLQHVPQNVCQKNKKLRYCNAELVAQSLCSSHSAALHLINIHFLLIHGVGLDARIQEERQSLKGRDSALQARSFSFS